ncbi:MAG: MFS transporter, partial [Gemmatimonadaceae bacterium]|nr:MFS transporter [Acetobacteraceae bacterium]
QAGPWRDPVFRWALLASALIQGGHAAYYGFATLHWRAAGIPDATIGLLIALGIVAEVALFVWGRRLVERLGPVRLTVLAAGGSIVRWTATAFVTDIGGLAAIQMLHALTFACQHLATMQILRGMDPRRAGTAQALMAALGFSAPTGLLIWLSGAVYGAAGGLTFLVMAAVGGSALLLVPALGRSLTARNARPGRSDDTSSR